MTAGLLTTQAVADMLGVSVCTVRRYADEGLLAVAQLTPRGHRRFAPADVLALSEDLLPTAVGEEWRPAVGYEGAYEVSSLGRVRSLPGSCRHVGLRKLHIDDDGYPTVSLWGPKKTWLVHQLVAYAFHGPRPERMEVRHLDGVKTNVAAVNLTYGTSSENSLDVLAHGNHQWAKRTECKNGHAFDAENTRWAKQPNGRQRRVCRTCERANKTASRARRRDLLDFGLEIEALPSGVRT